MRRITKAALGSLAGSAVILAGTQLAGGAAGTYTFSGALVDLQTSPTSVGPLDSAEARVTIVETADGTQFSFRITGIDQDYVGEEFGAHLHTGLCVEGSGSAAGPHYNTDVLAGVRANKVEISPNTEVWFDLVVDDKGMAYDETWVPFVPDPGDDGVLSIVIHADTTDPETGLAGTRQACLPLDFSSIDD